MLSFKNIGIKSENSAIALNSNGHNKENKDKECNGQLSFGQLSSPGMNMGAMVSLGSPALPTPVLSGTNNNGLLMNSSLITLGHSVATSDCLEALLRNIEGLVAIAAHNARQQQNQLNIHKGKCILFNKKNSDINSVRFHAYYEKN